MGKHYIYATFGTNAVATNRNCRRKADYETRVGRLELSSLQRLGSIGDVVLVRFVVVENLYLSVSQAYAVPSSLVRTHGFSLGTHQFWRPQRNANSSLLLLPVLCRWLVH